jgi:hypothetical protein
MCLKAAANTGAVSSCPQPHSCNAATCIGAHQLIDHPPHTMPHTKPWMVAANSTLLRNTRIAGECNYVKLAISIPFHNTAANGTAAIAHTHYLTHRHQAHTNNQPRFTECTRLHTWYTHPAHLELPAKPKPDTIIEGQPSRQHSSLARSSLRVACLLLCRHFASFLLPLATAPAATCLICIACIIIPVRHLTTRTHAIDASAGAATSGVGIAAAGTGVAPGCCCARCAAARPLEADEATVSTLLAHQQVLAMKLHKARGQRQPNQLSPYMPRCT